MVDYTLAPLLKKNIFHLNSVTFKCTLRQRKKKHMIVLQRRYTFRKMDVDVTKPMYLSFHAT